MPGLTKIQKRINQFDRWLGKPQARVSVTDRYAEFKARYFNDPVAFAQDCIHWGAGESLAPYQMEVMSQVVERRRVAAVGPHGLGKSAMMAIMVLWFALTRDGLDWKCPMTASVWGQLTNYLMPELRKWSRRVNWRKVGRSPFIAGRELLKESLNLTTGSAFATASDKPEAIEGAHADEMLYILDEAKAIPDKMYAGIEGAFSTTGNIYVMVVSTPGDNTGQFFQIHTERERYKAWWVRAVTLEECVEAGRISMTWAAEKELEWGRSSADYQRRVLGRFFQEDSPNGLIPRAWVWAANKRWLQWKIDAGENRRPLPSFSGLGVDVGGESDSGDSSVIATRMGWFFDELKIIKGFDPLQLAFEVYQETRKHSRPGWVQVDKIGIGAGVIARLRQLGVDVYGWDAAGAYKHLTDSTNQQKFASYRSWAWWRMRELLDPMTGSMIALPPDQDLEDELCAPTRGETANGEIQVESKRAIRKRLGRSTDRADAIIMAAVDTPIAVKPDPGEEFALPIG